MAAKVDDKRIIINGKTMLYGTSIKVSPETKTSSISTFSGVINQGLKDIPWTIECEKLRYEDFNTYKELSETLESMLSKPAMVTVIEIVRSGDKSFTVRDNYYDCLVDGAGYEIKPDEQTTENLKFKAAKRKRQWK